MDVRVKAAIDTMQKSLPDRLSIGAISKSVNLSPSGFRQLFKKETGRSPIKYLNELRLQRAAQLIRSTFLSIKEVTALTGIGDTSHFVRSFKKQYGQTPSEFRAQSEAARSDRIPSS